MKIVARAPLGFEADITLGPSSSFKVLGPSVFVGMEETPAAHWINHQWALRARRFTTLDVNEPAMVKFLGGANDIPRIGPFKAIRMADGSLIADDVMLARFDPQTSRWTTCTNVDCAGFQLEGHAHLPSGGS